MQRARAVTTGAKEPQVNHRPRYSQAAFQEAGRSSSSPHLHHWAWSPIAVCRSLRRSGLHPAGSAAGPRLERTASGGYRTVPVD